MKRVLTILGIMTVLAAGAGTALPAAAADLVSTGPCVDLAVHEEFSPPLDLTAELGTVTKSADDRLCAQASVSTSPPGVAVQAIDASHGDLSYPYVGTCGLAAYAVFGGMGLIVGGTVDVFVDPAAPGVSALVLVPDQVCNVSSADGAGALVFNSALS